LTRQIHANPLTFPTGGLLQLVQDIVYQTERREKSAVEWLNGCFDAWILALIDSLDGSILE